VWNAYAEAFRKRHGAAPPRNGRTNKILCDLVDRIGADAPAVAAHYVASNFRRYVEEMHPVGLLLLHAEKLRTEWATGRRVTAHEAREVDTQQGKGDGWRRVFEKLAREDAEDAKSVPPHPPPKPAPEPVRPSPPPSQYENFTGRTDEAWKRFRG
jgi:hypothetical protein